MAKKLYRGSASAVRLEWFRISALFGIEGGGPRSGVPAWDKRSVLERGHNEPKVRALGLSRTVPSTN